MQWIKPVTLVGQNVILKPLEESHHLELSEAVQDGELWKLWYTSIPKPENMLVEIHRRLALQQQGQMLPFTVFERHSGKVLGMTSFMNIDVAHHRLEIGSTWYRQSAQRSAVNTEAKQLLLSHAFDVLNCIAVEFRTSSFNFKSRAAIERLGAKLDGILRSHQIVKDDILRDTYVYSILQSEWPAVRQNLVFKLRR
ncbi:GNAT family N-acetyltransferase [Acinetobacter zhairhuonensis]|uniref:GNAT family N-acetyltransferase n=1 Tax=Acinetobacter sp. A7.4 TaxID=2919921 RepID=UPI001F4E829E|nr:GNAT family protein [Acinetobacter sp. A7.4]MCJ8159973.1 GNAT family N-acetyltransferase [Acinetobacter sp. A7.4]